MKKIFIPVLVVTLVMALASCGANRKLGCPATAKSSSQGKNVVS